LIFIILLLDNDANAGYKPRDEADLNKQLSYDKQRQDEAQETYDFGDVPLSAMEQKSGQNLLEDDNYDFAVINPQLTGGHIVYHAKGVDK
jgi:hypothetical protein